MKQQFIGLQHCKCGTSWQNGMDYFEREPNMVFTLERRKKGNKTKQVTVIRIKNDVESNIVENTVLFDR